MDQTTRRTSEIPVAEEDNDAGGSAPLTDTSQASVKKGFSFAGIRFESGYELSEIQRRFRQIEISKAKAYEKSFEFPEIRKLIQQREIAKAKIYEKRAIFYERFGDVKPLSDLYHGYTCCHDLDPDPASFNIARREDRKRTAERFRNLYIYGTSPDGPDGPDGPNGCTNLFAINGCTKPFAGTREKRICIGSKGPCFWEEKLSGIMWVSVHGMDSVCVVTRSGDLDWKRVRSGLSWTDVGTVLSYFRISIISEIEDLVDTPSEPLNMIIEKPFGVVCVPDTTDIHNECGHEASSIGYDVGKAVKFLQDKMTSETSFTVIETIQTAISAFQHMLQKKFKANEIEVSVMDPKYFILIHEKKHPSVKRLEMCEIEEYLVAINDEPVPREKTDRVAVVDDHVPSFTNPYDLTW